MAHTNEPTCALCGRPMNDWLDLRLMTRRGAAAVDEWDQLLICYLGDCPAAARRRGYEDPI